MDSIRYNLTQEHAIGALQTIFTAFILQKLSKRYRWQLLGGLAALELPLRLMDDGNNASGREAFLALLSLAYVLFASVTKVLVNSARAVARALSVARGPAPPPQAALSPHPRSPGEILNFIQQSQPTLEELVAQFGDSRDQLFAVLEAQGAIQGDVVVLV